MSDDAFQKAEQRGYARGYAAGRKKQKQDRHAEAIRKERQAFKDKAFLAILPFAFEQATWKFGEKPINTPEDRVTFAWRIAERAAKTRGIE
jgi:hypothetical protein